jgi:hypothetical protein
MHAAILPHIAFDVDEDSLTETGNNTGFVAGWKEFLFPLKSANLCVPNTHPSFFLVEDIPLCF